MIKTDEEKIEEAFEAGVEYGRKNPKVIEPTTTELPVTTSVSSSSETPTKEQEELTKNLAEFEKVKHVFDVDKMSDETRSYAKQWCDLNGYPYGSYHFNDAARHYSAGEKAAEVRGCINHRPVTRENSEVLELARDMYHLLVEDYESLKAELAKRDERYESNLDVIRVTYLSEIEKKDAEIAELKNEVEDMRDCYYDIVKMFKAEGTEDVRMNIRAYLDEADIQSQNVQALVVAAQAAVRISEQDEGLMLIELKQALAPFEKGGVE